MKFDYATRVKVGIILIILFALLSSVRLLKQIPTFNPKFMGRDEITLYERRFEGLKKMLPPHGVVGYITAKEGELVAADGESIKEYHLTQYALSPLVVVNTIECPLVVGNFYDVSINPEIYTNRNLILLKDFGDGVMLFKNEAK